MFSVTRTRAQVPTGMPTRHALSFSKDGELATAKQESLNQK
jgi:hypothetical protein